MAKKQTVNPGILQSTTKAKTEQEAKPPRRRPIGVYLKNDVHAALEEIAQENDLTIHGLISYSVSYFIRQYRAGKAKIETETKTVTKTSI